MNVSPLSLAAWKNETVTSQSIVLTTVGQRTSRLADAGSQVDVWSKFSSLNVDKLVMCEEDDQKYLIR